MPPPALPPHPVISFSVLFLQSHAGSTCSLPDFCMHACVCVWLVGYPPLLQSPHYSPSLLLPTSAAPPRLAHLFQDGGMGTHPLPLASNLTSESLIPIWPLPWALPGSGCGVQEILPRGSGEPAGNASFPGSSRHKDTHTSLHWAMKTCGSWAEVSVHKSCSPDPVAMAIPGTCDPERKGVAWTLVLPGC